MKIKRWLYRSVSLLPSANAAAAVEEIVAISITRNANLDVTGALVFAGDRFAQLIEGPVQGINALRASIAADGRHSHVTTLLDDWTDQRLFAQWSLAYVGEAQFVRRSIGEPLSDVEIAVGRLIRIMQEFSS